MQIDLLYVGVTLGVVLLSMTIHEAMHAFAGYWLGDTTAKDEGRLTLNPFAHIDPFLTILLPVLLALAGGPIFGGAKPVPFNPYRVRYGEFGAAIVGAAGPLTNLVLAFIAFGIFVLAGTPSASSLEGLILQASIYINLGFFIFNSLPIPPLDGSRVLYALAPDAARRVMESIERFGVFFVFAVVFLFNQQLTQFMTAAINFFVNLFAALFGVTVV